MLPIQQEGSLGNDLMMKGRAMNEQGWTSSQGRGQPQTGGMHDGRHDRRMDQDAERQPQSSFGQGGMEASWMATSSPPGAGPGPMTDEAGAVGHYGPGYSDPRRHFGGGSVTEQHHDHYDPDYHQWRNEQMRLLDDDYQAWRRERDQRHFSEFDEWRRARRAGMTGGDAAGERPRPEGAIGPRGGGVSITGEGMSPSQSGSADLSSN
ncbi:major ampullate spidroin [Caldimonas brevitalea]|uniref:Major ampullate spidroin n=1 Tax=Caldimonas brevitalea TaxID=413882 RepID=A0A0G3BI87_9BURK|nr:major ampullate spidroin [Caldimonas brevitalea]